MRRLWGNIPFNEVDQMMRRETQFDSLNYIHTVVVLHWRFDGVKTFFFLIINICPPAVCACWFK
jgi:hypothetical protein